MKMSLPVEIWMMVLERITLDESVLARSRVVQAFAEAMDCGANEEAALEDLPYFEKRAWARAKVYYHIDTNSRAAAERLRLSTKLLRACKAVDTKAPVDV